jgi:murein DD-endopeptidase MepM/ murein hydrolase activator NlpD
LAAGCGSGPAAAPKRTTTTASTSSSTTTTTTAPTTTLAPTTTVAPTTTAAPPTTAPTTSTTHPHPPRVVTEEAWIPYSQAGPVVLRLPSDHVEAIGYHESTNDGAQPQTPLPGSPRWFVMGDRERDTNRQGAADIVVEPGRAIRAPVSGTVVRSGTYTLYCDYTDDYVVINPDSRPGWEVKLLHIQGLRVTKGQRVDAGVTVVAAHAHVLPFPSQVEDDTGLPPWPHVHVEVVDPSIPDRPGPPCK